MDVSPSPGTSNGIGTALVVYAKEMPKVAAFYQQVLGLKTVEQEAGFVLLQGGGIALSIVRIPEHIAATFTVASPPEAREDTAVKAAFRVRSLAQLPDLVAATGGLLKPLHDAWRFRGDLHLDGCDPEGNVVQFVQAAP